MVRDTLANVVLNTAERIQRRRQVRGKRQIIRRNLAQVPRRQGGLGRLPVPQVKITQVASAVGSTLSKMQSEATTTVKGTEIVYEIVNTGPAMSFSCLKGLQMNPADPGVMPSLAAIVSQYQCYKFRNIACTFTPSTTTTTSGNLYVACYPNPTQKNPDTAEEMVDTLGGEAMPVYGVARSFVLKQAQLQQAYKIQSVKVDENPIDATALNCVGVIYVGVDSCAANLTIGKLSITYDIECSVKKLQQGANSLHAHYVGGAVTGSVPLVFDDSDLLLGYHNLIPTATDGDYMLRQRQTVHLLVIDTTGSGATGYDVLVSTSSDAATWVLAPQLFKCTDSSHHQTTSIYRLPRSTYVRIHNDAAANLSGFRIYCAALRD